MNLTEPQKRDLIRLYHHHKATVGTYDYPHGDAIRLRTGKSLAKFGLVVWGNQYSANRYKRWRITEEGIRVARELLEKKG